MSNLLRLSTLTVAAITLMTGIAAADTFYPPFVAHYDPPPPANGGGSGGGSTGDSSAPEPARAIKLICIVGGSPAEFPNDIWITNTTASTLVKGTAMRFSIPAVGVKGSFLLPSNVPSGKQLKIADLFGGAEAGSPCTVKI